VPVQKLRGTSGGVGDHGVGGIWAEGLVEEQDAEVAEGLRAVGLTWLAASRLARVRWKPDGAVDMPLTQREIIASTSGVS
jgi:hypothetical protein